jgi:hypothetical protein
MEQRTVPLSSYQKDFIERVRWDKPLKAISAYTAADVDEMAVKAHMPEELRAGSSKKEKYEWLMQQL